MKIFLISAYICLDLGFTHSFFVSSEALGLVSRCRIPTVAVAQLGLFRILLGSSVSVENVQSKFDANTNTFNDTTDTYDTSYTATTQSYTSSRPDNTMLIISAILI